MTPEQILKSQQANLKTLNGLTNKAFEGFEKLVELNMQAAKTILAESQANTESIMSVKDAQELVNLQASMFQPLAEKVAAYNRHLYDIAAGTTSEFSKAVEGQMSENQEQFSKFMDNAAKNAPAGSETAVAMMQSAMSAANNAFDSVQKAVKQASDIAETNFATASANAQEMMKKAGTVTPAKKK